MASHMISPYRHVYMHAMNSACRSPFAQFVGSNFVCSRYSTSAPIRAAPRRAAAYFPRLSRRTTMQYVYFHSTVTRCAG